MALPEGIRVEADVRAIFADDHGLLEMIDWAWLRVHAYSCAQFRDEQGPLMHALEAVHRAFYNEVLLDPERPRSGPRGRQGRPPSSRVVRQYVERLERLADLLERDEATLAQLEVG